MARTVRMDIFYEDSSSMSKLNELLSSFVCPYENQDLAKFLRDKAINFDKRNLSRTYLVLDDAFENILGYFSIGMKAVKLGDDISKSKRESITSGNSNEPYVASFILAQIGKSDKSNFKKGELLDMAIKTIVEIQVSLSGRIIYLDCKKELINYYSKAGFAVLRQSDDFTQMVKRI